MTKLLFILFFSVMQLFAMHGADAGRGVKRQLSLIEHAQDNELEDNKVRCVREGVLQNRLANKPWDYAAYCEGCAASKRRNNALVLRRVDEQNIPLMVAAQEEGNLALAAIYARFASAALRSIKPDDNDECELWKSTSNKVLSENLKIKSAYEALRAQH